MKKKKLLILIAVLAVLSAAAVAVRMTDFDKSDETEDTSIDLVSIPEDSIEAITWDNDGTTLCFVKQDGEWVYQEDTGFPFDSSNLDNMQTAVSSIVASRMIEPDDSTDLSDYGLETPVHTVTVTTADGDVTIEIGNETFMKGSCYVSVGDGNIYLADLSLSEAFDYSLNDLIIMDEIPDMTTIRKFKVTLPEGGYVLEERTTGDIDEQSGEEVYGWYLSNGEGVNLTDTANSFYLMENITELNWVTCVAYNMTTSEELSQFGLDVPRATITVTYTVSTEVDSGEVNEDGSHIMTTEETDQEYVLEFGDTISSYIFVKPQGSDKIYVVDSEMIEKILNTTYDDLKPSEDGDSD